MFLFCTEDHHRFREDSIRLRLVVLDISMIANVPVTLRSFPETFIAIECVTLSADSFWINGAITVGYDHGIGIILVDCLI